MRNNFVKRLLERARENKNIILMCGDLGYGVLDEFKKTLPRQFINAGISEQNMLSMAAGMALEGKKVFVYSIGNFPTLRPLEQIRNDVCYHNADVKIVCVGGGFAYGALGMSHHATEDIAVLRALPNMTVLTPCDTSETVAATDYACDVGSPCYIRLGKGGEPNIHNNACDYAHARAVLAEAGTDKDTVIFACGPIIAEAKKANEILRSQNKPTVPIYSFISVKPIDKELIYTAAGKYKKIIAAEEHNIVGGFGSAVAEVLSEIKHGSILKRIGLRDCYSGVVGDREYLRKIYSMDSGAILKEIELL